MHLPSNVPRALEKTLSDLRTDYLDVRSPSFRPT